MTTAADTFEEFKQAQKQSWAHFAPLEVQTILPAAQLVKHAKVRAGQRVLDVACGTGVVSLTSARMSSAWISRLSYSSARERIHTSAILRSSGTKATSSGFPLAMR